MEREPPVQPGVTPVCISQLLPLQFSFCFPVQDDRTNHTSRLRMSCINLLR
jgi:hypothetical protein